MTAGRNLSAVATLFGATLAGGFADRALVQMPAWKRLGAERWAEYSRQADLRSGFAVYPTEAFGGLILSIAAAIALHRERAPRPARVAACAAALLAAGGLLVTAKAAPIMLSMRENKSDDEARAALDGFWSWSQLRGALQVGAFVANVATLARLSTKAS
ncbi:MAG TPA: hypothetical protein VG323_04205 [Thermoanaerobaculia bacterium]|nr:hypothetical protein [Thermoanaerobaculia bacterium]